MYAIAKIIRAIPKLKGSKGALSLGAEQIRLMAKEDKALAKVIGTLKEPTMDIAYKAKSNYNVAAFKLRDGKNVVANGALSFQNPATTESILKYRINVGENGRVARVNGFVDAGKKLDFEDIAVAAKSKKGIITAEVESGQALRHAARIDENAAVKLAEQIQPGSGYGLKDKILGGTAKARTKLNDMWTKLAKRLSGEAPAVKPMASEAAEFKKVKPLDPKAGEISKKFKAADTGDVKDIKEYIAKNPNFLKEAKIGSIKQDIIEMQKYRKDLLKKFETCTDPETKAMLANNYKEVEEKLMRSNKYLEEVTKKNPPEFS